MHITSCINDWEKGIKLFKMLQNVLCYLGCVTSASIPFDVICSRLNMGMLDIFSIMVEANFLKVVAQCGLYMHDYVS